ncbi:MAG: 50S ribosomal protein L3 N(5)-glutamine methyltransferase [Pseudomonadota bacterium]
MSNAAPQTVGAAIDAVASRFAAAPLTYGHGTESAWDEAVSLVCHLTTQPDVQASRARALLPTEWAQIEALVQQRIEKRIPLAHLLGSASYLGLRFAVEPGLMIPRSPLGLVLYDEAEDWLPAAPARVLDLCCGTGCLGIVAALMFPAAQVSLVDLDPRALTLARRNAASHGVAERCSFRCEDARRLRFDAPFDLVLCNPPYVNAADMAALPAEYRAEPELGLAAGVDGLTIIRPVLAELSSLLTCRGVFMGEVGRSRPAFEAAPLVPEDRWRIDWIESAEGVFVLRPNT